MNPKQILGGLSAILCVAFVIAGCTDLQREREPASILTLSTPAPLTQASAGVNADGSVAVPQQIVVILVTPTPGEDSGQQSGDQQGEQNNGQAQNGQQGGDQQGSEQQGSEQQGSEQQNSDQQEDQQGEAVAQAGGGSGGANEEELIRQGEQIYTDNCASCHQPNGEGTSTYPALAGSAALTGEDPSTPVDIVVNGRGQMPAFGGTLSAEQIAAVISYERNSWGNSAGVVTVDHVNQVMGGGSSSGGQQSGEQQAGDQSEQGQSEQGQSGEQQAAGQQQESGGQQEQGQQQSSSNVQIGQDGTITLRIEIVVLSEGSGTSQPEQPSSQSEAAASPTPEATSEPNEEAQAAETPQPEPQGDEQSQQPAESEAQESGGEETSGEQGEQGQSQTESTAQQGEEGTVTLRIEVVVLPAGETPQPDAQSPQQAQPEATASPTPEPTEEAQEEQPQEESAQEESAQEAPAQTEATPEAEEGAAEQSGEQAEEAAAAGDQTLQQMGELVYAMNCANCHQLSGDGNTAYPPLNGSEIVTAEDPTAALLVILNGRGHMPAFAGLLSDEEIAAALSHERTSWTNNASTVSIAQVQQARESGGGGSEQNQQRDQGQPDGEGSEEESNEGASAAIPLDAIQPNVEPVAFVLRDRTNPSKPIAVAAANAVNAPSGASPGPIEVTIVLSAPASP